MKSLQTYFSTNALLKHSIDRKPNPPIPFSFAHYLPSDPSHPFIETILTPLVYQFLHIESGEEGILTLRKKVLLAKLLLWKLPFLLNWESHLLFHVEILFLILSMMEWKSLLLPFLTMLGRPRYFLGLFTSCMPKVFFTEASSTDIISVWTK